METTPWNRARMESMESKSWHRSHGTEHNERNPLNRTHGIGAMETTP